MQTERLFARPSLLKKRALIVLAPKKWWHNGGTQMVFQLETLLIEDSIDSIIISNNNFKTPKTLEWSTCKEIRWYMSLKSKVVVKLCLFACDMLLERLGLKGFLHYITYITKAKLPGKLWEISLPSFHLDG